MTSATPRKPSMSLAAATLAILVAFVVGLFASLAVRPRTQVVDTAGKKVIAETAGSAGAAAEQIRWRVPVAFKSTLPGLGDTIVTVANALKESSGGAIEWKVFEPGKLLPAFGITEGVKDKKVQGRLYLARL